MKKALIIGANGQLGSDIDSCLLKHNYVTLIPNHSELDIVDFEKIKQYLSNHKPDVVINTAAYHHVDLCEENPELATKINTVAPTNLSIICKEMNIKFIHFSTDYVFDGVKHKPYIESDYPNPLNVYGRTKFEGEKGVMLENSHALVIRISAIYGVNPCRAKNGLNFIQLMLKLAKEKDELNVVGDEIVSPTATYDIANLLPILIEKEVCGIIHLTSEGECSWHEFASEIFNYTHTQIKLNKVDSAFFPAKTPRPKYSVLENESIKSKGIQSLPHWRDALHNYLNNIKN